MEIRKSNKSDLDQIFDLYRIATDYMKSKNQVSWPEFDRKMVETEIEEGRQYKLSLDGNIACIWAIALSDEEIWGADNKDASVYLHRIATDPDYRGRGLVSKVIDWANDYALNHNLKYVRLDTVGPNEGLIRHYQRHGFDYLGTRQLENTSSLPEHYSMGPVCLFQKEVKDDL